ncbi:MAG: class I SAM-dependent methyltransferase [Anaerolineales bacterium]
MIDNSERPKRLNLVDQDPGSAEREVVRRVVQSYSNTVVRLYSTIRFRVIPLRFLNELAQYIPDQGCVLDLGCGFGLFTLYFAALKPASQFVGVDVSRSRIAMAMGSASKLGIRNSEFVCSDIRQLEFEEPRFDTVMTLDLMHHLPVQEGNSIIQTVHSDWLSSRGTFVMKDVTTWPRPMLYFTFLLDLLMNPRDSFYYRSADAWIDYLAEVGFASVEKHYLWDLLPYPHILLIARNREP